eukprot:1146608-Pelagomonas_calceolata.AAC.7
MHPTCCEAHSPAARAADWLRPGLHPVWQPLPPLGHALRLPPGHCPSGLPVDVLAGSPTKVATACNVGRNTHICL